MGGTLVLFGFAPTQAIELDDAPLQPFLEEHCYECHDDLTAKGGLDLFELGLDLSDEATAATWERIFDRVSDGEMPPKDQPRPSDNHVASFRNLLATPLVAAHEAEKGTVLRRLNRSEYENTMNDLFGTYIDFAEMLPEDGRSHEFDNVGEALGMSMTQMQRYLEAGRLALNTALVDTVEPPESGLISASYAESSETEKFVGKEWHLLDDGAIAFYRKVTYPDGQLRESNVREAGIYRVRVTGYAYQSEEPVSLVVKGKTYRRGAKQPTYGYFELPPKKDGKPHSIEFETYIDSGYMVQIQPEGIFRTPQSVKSVPIQEYDGPGLAISKVELEGPITRDFPGRGEELILGSLQRREVEPSNPEAKTKSWYKPSFELVPPDGVELNAAVAQTLWEFASKVFRRPVEKAEIDPYLALYESEITKESSVEDALVTAETAILCAPDFLYLREQPGRLSGSALANRLSYFLTRTAPDSELLSAAEDMARDPATLVAQTNRLIGEAPSDRFLDDFTNAWLNLREIEFTAPDRNLFPEFDPYLQDSMLRETRAFLGELIGKNISIEHLVKSDFAMLNERLAEHYEIEHKDLGPELQRVALPADSVRGGLLSQGSILKVSANGTNTSPVLRGVWVLERILGITPSPPPPGTPGVEPDIRGAETLRQLLDKHRDVESCQSCHQQIDPPGFALESFDPIGGWRDRFRTRGEGERINKQVDGQNVRYKLGLPVDSAGALPTGEAFSGFVEFRELLAKDTDRLARTLIKKLLVFGTGREMGFSDRPEINRLVQASAAQGHGIRDLVHLVVSSDIFRNK